MENEEMTLLFEETSEYVSSLAWSPDSRILAMSSSSSTQLWDVEIQRSIRAMANHSKHINHMAWSPDGRILAFGVSDEEHAIKLWDVDIQKYLDRLSATTSTSSGSYYYPEEELRTYIGHSSGVNSVAWSPDGHILASGSSDRTIKLWSVENWENILTLQGHSLQVNSIAWSPYGNILASGAGEYNEKGVIKLWDVTTGENIQTLQGHPERIVSIAWSPDGRTLASASYDGTIKLWPRFFTLRPCKWINAGLTSVREAEFQGNAIELQDCP